jgi:predicted DNA binding CopG/RHH family protein
MKMQKGKKALKLIPFFSSEDEEDTFWGRVDSTDYFPGKGSVHFKMPSRTTTISLRLPNRLFKRLKNLAELKDVPYQSLLKIYVDEKVRDEMTHLKKAS